jgi:hypothetical protein
MLAIDVWRFNELEWYAALQLTDQAEFWHPARAGECPEWLIIGRR